jgi:hypothetical protein
LPFDIPNTPCDVSSNLGSIHIYDISIEIISQQSDEYPVKIEATVSSDNWDDGMIALLLNCYDDSNTRVKQICLSDFYTNGEKVRLTSGSSSSDSKCTIPSDTTRIEIEAF